MRPFSHTPFATCMTSVGTLALLSACKFLFKSQELAIARGQIRMTIGRLKSLADIWPRVARNLQEIQMIARDVLSLVPKATDVMAPMQNMADSGIDLGSGSGTGSSSDDTFPDVPLDGVVPSWDSFGDMGPGLCWWMNGNLT